jgi:hypothetical protein
MHPLRTAMTTAAALALASAARADVYFEITPSGQLPNGVVDSVPLLTPASFDVYVWGSGADTGLLHTNFAVAAAERFGWLMLDLGVPDPADLFTSQFEGAFGFFPDGIGGIAVESATPVPLPTDMGSALKIYQGFMARPDEPSALMDVYPVIVTANTGANRPWHTTGVIATPAPGAALLLAGASALTGACRTRRRGS